MKILILSKSPWDDTNSLGNTLTNLFSNYGVDGMSNLYCRSTLPQNCVCKHYFAITDKEVAKSIIFAKTNVGSSFTMNDPSSTRKILGESDEAIYQLFRGRSSYVALWVQELIWKVGKWRNNNLKKFVDDFSPDIIFAPAFSAQYMHRLLWYLHEETGSQIALFHADDYLSCSSKKLLSRVHEKKRAKAVKISAQLAGLNYCISEMQREEYQSKLGKEMKLLYKGADFSNRTKATRDKKHLPVKIVYIGSVYYGRWKTLSLLARQIAMINQDAKRFELVIYSQYIPTPEMTSQMIIEGSSVFMGKIPADQVADAYAEADIVLHIESFDDVEKQKTRLSFSTKIVDCLHSNRAVMAIGWEKAASIKYLIDNDAALVASNDTEVQELLNKIIKNPQMLDTYADKAWSCGERNHQITEIQRRLFQDFEDLVSPKQRQNATDD